VSDQAPPTSPGVDPELVSLTADDLEDVVAGLEGMRLVLAGLVVVLRKQAAASRREGLQ